MTITIDGSEPSEIRKVYKGGYLPLLVLEDGTEWHVAHDSKSAGEAASQYWRDMAENDPKEFACIIGEERLVQWGLGQSDSYGISGIQDFCECNAQVPEENFASYDCQERNIAVPEWTDENPEEDDPLTIELGFYPTVAYRHN